MRKACLVVRITSMLMACSTLACTRDAISPAAIPVTESVPAPAAAAKSSKMNPTAYVALLEELTKRVANDEADFSSLDARAAERGRFDADIARSKKLAKDLRVMLARARRILAHSNGASIAAAICTDDGEPDECDGDDGGGTGGGTGPSGPFNSTRHIVTNPLGGSGGLSLADSYGLISVNSVDHNHHVTVTIGNSVVLHDSLKTSASYVGLDPFTGIKTYSTMLQFNMCGYSAGYAAHTFRMSPMPDETLNSQNFDSTCKDDEEVAEEGGGGGGSHTDEQGELWCYFISWYNANGELTSRHNTGNCWRM